MFVNLHRKRDIPKLEEWRQALYGRWLRSSSLTASPNCADPRQDDLPGDFQSGPGERGPLAGAQGSHRLGVARLEVDGVGARYFRRE
jgi:hypothetical protein